MPMTPTLDELRKLSEAATPGPWGFDDVELGTINGWLEPDEFRPIVHCSGTFTDWDANSAFIAALVNWFRQTPDPIAAAYLAGQQSMRERAAQVSEATLTNDRRLALEYGVGSLLSSLEAYRYAKKTIAAAIRALPDAPSDGGADPTPGREER